MPREVARPRIRRTTNTGGGIVWDMNEGNTNPKQRCVVYFSRDTKAVGTSGGQNMMPMTHRAGGDSSLPWRAHN